MRKRSLTAMATIAISIGLAGFVATGCGLETPGGVLDPTEEPDSSGGQGKDLVVPRQGSEFSQLSNLLEQGVGLS